MSGRTYKFNAGLRIWQTSEHDSIGYSDGETVERRLLEALRQCRDLSSTSDEVRQQIVDWPSEYHFSPLRHALLRPFSFSPSDRILEFGCGCGAITRYLGETGATVVAVEGNRLRAQIAAERCRDLPNVRVICDNLEDFEIPERFDTVTLIGVLEYAPVFVSGEQTVQRCLQKARQSLAAGGNLLLAIENQLGLKYFAGCAEDHIGLPFFGIEQLYGERTVVTFGRRALAEALASSGLDQLQWYYPFPDYKLPRVIVSDAAMTSPDFDVATLLLRTCSRDYRGAWLRTFDETLARRVVWRNGLLGDLANSFLIVASECAPKDSHQPFLAKAYNLSRQPQFCTEATFSRDESDRIYINRAYVDAGGRKIQNSELGRITHQLPTEDYVTGQLLLEELHALARHGWSLERLSCWAAPWLASLRNNSCPDRPDLLPPQFVDFTPFNAIRCEQGKITYIDAEWKANEPIPLKWVFIRGLAYSLDNVMQPIDHGSDRRSLIVEIGTRLQLTLGDEDFVNAEQWEVALQCYSGPQKAACGGLASVLDRPPGRTVPIHGALTEAVDALTENTNSRSWRITKPLRWGLKLVQAVVATIRHDRR